MTKPASSASASVTAARATPSTSTVRAPANGTTMRSSWTARLRRRCDAHGGACGDIEDADTRTYAPGDTDVHATLRVVVTAASADATASAASAASTVVTAEPPGNTVAPEISGVATTGETLYATPG